MNNQSHIFTQIGVSKCVLAVYNKVQAQRISDNKFKLWTFLQGAESRVGTFLAETCLSVMSHQSLVCVLGGGVFARARARGCSIPFYIVRHK